MSTDYTAILQKTFNLNKATALRIEDQIQKTHGKIGKLSAQDFFVAGKMAVLSVAKKVMDGTK